MKKLQLILATIFISIVMFSVIPLGCGQSTNPYVPSLMNQLLKRLTDLNSIEPSGWAETDAYLGSNHQDTDALGKRLDEALSTYNDVKAYLNRSINNEPELGAWRELGYLRTFLLLGAEQLKAALDLLKKDMGEKTEASFNIIFDIGDTYRNDLRQAFLHEYNRLADQYSLEEI